MYEFLLLPLEGDAGGAAVQQSADMEIEVSTNSMKAAED
jgi:hypothetical protein